jgi:uncharacterized protein with von Willebrand factor type A (vWA) domain
MTEMVLRLLRAARGAGVRISVAETLDAFAAVSVIGYDDRQTLRDALTISLAKTTEEKWRFEQCFDLYFRRDSVDAAAPAEDGAPGADQDAATDAALGKAQTPLAQMLLANDQAALSAAMEAAADDMGSANIVLFTQTNMFARRILDGMGLPELDREIARLKATGDADDAAVAERLERARQGLGDQARSFMERQLALFGAEMAREIREDALRTVSLSQLDRRDMVRMRAMIREMAKRLATRYSRYRWRDRRGQLDLRRTLRRNMAYDSIPFHTVWKRKRIDKPRVMALCDVSGSVANVARFLLMFLYSLADVMADIRSFAYSSHLIEVSSILQREESDTAVTKILDDIGFGTSNYGRSLDNFVDIAMDDLDRQTTVLILGDARGNNNDPRVQVMQQIFHRAGRVIWLNPESEALWGIGDSDMLRYLPYCHVATTCNTVEGLERVIEEVLREKR